MAKVNVTYNAPEDDSPVVTTGGKRFFDGQPLELDTNTHSELVDRLRGNQHFTVEDVAVEAVQLTPGTGGGWNN